MEKKHAIIIIKNSKDEYLQYFDKRWNSYLFLNCKIKDECDVEAVEHEVMQKLNIKTKKILYRFDRIHTKFSESDKIEKKYHHYFYDVILENDESISNTKEFKNNDIDFKWYSYGELLQDNRIQEVNADIIRFIKEVENNLENRGKSK